MVQEERCLVEVKGISTLTLGRALDLPLIPSGCGGNTLSVIVKGKDKAQQSGTDFFLAYFFRWDFLLPAASDPLSAQPAPEAVCLALLPGSQPSSPTAQGQ